MICEFNIFLVNNLVNNPTVKMMSKVKTFFISNICSHMAVQKLKKKTLKKSVTVPEAHNILA